MAGIFARFSGKRSGHRRTKSAMEVRESLAPTLEVESSVGVGSHGNEAIAIEFKPVEHPIEPPNNDQPIRCPLPEPSILNDGRIWKERMTSANSKVRVDLPIVREGSQSESETGARIPRNTRPKRVLLPSLSAPEHHMLSLLEECSKLEKQTFDD